MEDRNRNLLVLVDSRRQDAYPDVEEGLRRLAAEGDG